MGALRTAAVLAAVAAAAAGCSSGGSGSSSSSPSSGASGGNSPADLLSASAQNAASIKSFTATVDLHSTGGSGSTGTTNVTGTISEQRQPTRLIELTTKSAETAGINAGAITVIETPSAIYTKIPSMSSLTGGKPYLEIPLSQAKSGTLGPLVNQAQSSNPLDAAQLLGGATDVQKVGSATVNGIPTTELKGTVPVSAAVAKLPAKTRSTVGKGLQQAGIDHFDFQVWLDGQNNLRKAVYTYVGKNVSMTDTTTITSINQPVHISIPPSSQVGKLPSSASGAGL